MSFVVRNFLLKCTIEPFHSQISILNNVKFAEITVSAFQSIPEKLFVLAFLWALTDSSTKYVSAIIKSFIFCFEETILNFISAISTTVELLQNKHAWKCAILSLFDVWSAVIELTLLKIVWKKTSRQSR